VRVNLKFPGWITSVLGAGWLACTPANAASTAATEALVPPPTPSVVKLAPAQIAAFHDYLVQEQKHLNLPGLAVVLVQPGQTLLMEGLGVRDANGNQPISVNTHFALGPATQAVNSLLLARLAEQDILSLDMPATRAWDEFKLADTTAKNTLSQPPGPLANNAPERINSLPATQNWEQSKSADRAAPPKVTLRHLLGMTAGVPERADNFVRLNTAMPADLFSVLAQIPVATLPGREFAYSDASVAAAGYLAVYAANHHHAPAAGLPSGYAELAKTQLFDPLGLKDATFEASANDALGHTRHAQGAWKSVSVEPANGGALRPALGLRASASDVAAWLQVEICGGLGSEGKSFVLKDAVEERWRPADDSPQHEYGLGWTAQHYRGIELITRAGEYEHQAELVAIIPQYCTAFALLTNGSGKETAVFLQDALLNLTDLLKETAAGQN